AGRFAIAWVARWPALSSPLVLGDRPHEVSSVRLHCSATHLACVALPGSGSGERLRRSLGDGRKWRGGRGCARRSRLGEVVATADTCGDSRRGGGESSQANDQF